MQNQKRGVNMKEHNATARKIVRAIEKRVRRAGKRECDGFGWTTLNLHTYHRLIAAREPE